MARELVDGMWQLELGFVAPLRSNAYLIDDRLVGVGREDGAADPENGDVTLVDTGLHRNWPTLRGELADAGYAPGDLDRVLLTHYDLDHVGGLARLLPELDGPVHIGTPDLALLEGERSPPILHHKGLFHRVVRRLLPLPSGIDLRSVADGDRIGAFRAYLTPGHNPGHVVYVHDAGIALLGDLVWEEEGSLTTPIGFDSYDLETLCESVRTLADRVGPIRVAAMGHGTPILEGADGALATLAAELS